MDDADGNDYDDDFGGHKKTASGSSSQTQDRSQLLALVLSPRTLISFTTFSLSFFFFWQSQVQQLNCNNCAVHNFARAAENVHHFLCVCKCQLNMCN